ncbi:MAG: TlpA disulfide reductase family protein [Planctomycetota bacterium]
MMTMNSCLQWARSGLTCAILGVFFAAGGCGGTADDSATENAEDQPDLVSPVDQAYSMENPGADSSDSNTGSAESSNEPSNESSNDSSNAMSLPPQSQFSLPPDGSGSPNDSRPGDIGSMELPPGESSAAPATAGDSGSSFELPSGDSGQNPAAQSGSASTSTSIANLEIAVWPSIRRQAESTGKVTVVDLWSTACAPCIKEFPGLVRLSKVAPAEIACLSVSVDYDGRKSRPPTRYIDRVAAFLTSMKAEFPNFVCATPSEEVFAALRIPSIPAVLVFDADGKLVKQFVDAGATAGFTYEDDVIPFVESISS